MLIDGYMPGAHLLEVMFNGIFMVHVTACHTTEGWIERGVRRDATGDWVPYREYGEVRVGFCDPVGRRDCFYQLTEDALATYLVTCALEAK